MRRPTTLALAIVLVALAAGAPAGAGKPEAALRASWVGRWVVLRTAVLSDCEDRYTNNRMRGPRPASSGRHRFDPGEIGRVDNLHLRRARVDLLIGLHEPLRVELRDGPFQLFEHRRCRVELEVPAPRGSVRGGDVAALERLLDGVLERHDGMVAAADSPLANLRRVEPLPEDHEERLAEYHAWKEQQLYLALRGRLAEALDRANDLAARLGTSAAYAQGMLLAANDFRQERLYSADCPELPDLRYSSSYGQPPDELDDDEARDWRDGYEDGHRLLFELALARRIERCLP